MCDITKELTKPITRTGYKIVINIKGKFYSPSTGLKYEVGMKIPKMKTVRDKYIDNRWGNPLNVSNYENRMQGNTGIFANLKDLLNTRIVTHITTKYSIIKVKLGDIKYEAEYSNNKVFVGSDIQEITEVMTGSDMLSLKPNLMVKIK